MRLSHDLIQLFRDDGYALVRGLIPTDLTASVRNRTMEVGRGEHGAVERVLNIRAFVLADHEVDADPADRHEAE